ncbi:MAG: iron-containing alcohol dehydrogenase family protein [Geminicoccaceae bacterium]
MPPSITFGCGALASLPALLADIGSVRPLLVTDACVMAHRHPAKLHDSMMTAGYALDIWDGVESDPAEDHVQACRARLIEGDYDAVIAMGGGSVIDVAKVASVMARHNLDFCDIYGFDRIQGVGIPVIAVPTNAGGGAEISCHAAIYAPTVGKKEVVAGTYCLARAAVIDPDLSLTLSAENLLSSSLDGLIHAMESSLARRANTITNLFAGTAIPLLIKNIPAAMNNPQCREVRRDLSLGCLYSAIAMANANVGAIHAVGYPISAGYGVPHGLANSAMAAVTLAAIWPGRVKRCSTLARMLDRRLLGVDDETAAASLSKTVHAFMAKLGVVQNIGELGVAPDDLDRLASQAIQFVPILKNTPVELSERDLKQLYRQALNCQPAGTC